MKYNYIESKKKEVLRKGPWFTTDTLKHTYAQISVLRTHSYFHADSFQEVILPNSKKHICSVQFTKKETDNVQDR